MSNSCHILFLMLVVVSSVLVMPLTFAQNARNSTNSILSNTVKTSNGGVITPLQTHDENGNNLTIHYEVGKDVTGKIQPPPPLESPQSNLLTIIIIGGIIGTAIVGIFVFIRMKKK